MGRKDKGQLGRPPFLPPFLFVPEPEAGIAFRASSMLHVLRGRPVGVLGLVR